MHSFSNLMIFLINSSSRMLSPKYPFNSHFRDRKRKETVVVSYKFFFSFFVKFSMAKRSSNEFICVKCGKKIGVSHHWSPMIPEFSLEFSYKNIFTNCWKSKTHRHYMSTWKSNKSSFFVCVFILRHILSERKIVRPSILHYHFKHICLCLGAAQNQKCNW